MAVNTSTISSMNSLFNSIFEDTLFVANESAIMPLLVTNYTAQGMADRKQGIYPQATAQTVGEGEAFSNPVEWTKTLNMTVTPFKVKTQVILTDERLATDPEEAQVSSSREMGTAIAKKIDQDLLGLFSSFDTDKGSAGASLTLAKVAAGFSVLQASNVQNPVNVVLHPYGWYDIWNQLGQPQATMSFLGDVANEALRQYFVSNWLNLRWFTSSNISIDANDDAVSGMFHQEALALDTRKPITPEFARDADRDAWKINMSAWYGKAVRRSGYGIALTHDAVEPTGA